MVCISISTKAFGSNPFLALKGSCGCNNTSKLDLLMFTWPASQNPAQLGSKLLFSQLWTDLGTLSQSTPLLNNKPTWMRSIPRTPFQNHPHSRTPFQTICAGVFVAWLQKGCNFILMNHRRLDIEYGYRWRYTNSNTSIQQIIAAAC